MPISLYGHYELGFKDSIVLPHSITSRDRTTKMNYISPYEGVLKKDWLKVTNDLVDEHPLSKKEIASFVLDAWEGIFTSSIGRHKLKIGEHIFPKPQVIGELLHELIPAELIAVYPDQWRREQLTDEKDIVNLKNDRYSVELKTSSNPNQIFGNRSYAQAPSSQKKSKNGYYLTVNFEKFDEKNKRPKINKVGFGWIEHLDWIGQASQTGQQARLAPETYELKILNLYQNK